MKTIVLVGCGKQKLTHAASAKDMYTSNLFKAARAYAETFGDEWYIVSASHGVTRPDPTMAPYDITLSDMSIKERFEWGKECADAIMEILAGIEEEEWEIVSLLGLQYSGYIEYYLQDAVHLKEPLRGMKIGKRIQFLKEAVHGRHI